MRKAKLAYAIISKAKTYQILKMKMQREEKVLQRSKKYSKSKPYLKVQSAKITVE